MTINLSTEMTETLLRSLKVAQIDCDLRIADTYRKINRREREGLVAEVSRVEALRNDYQSAIDMLMAGAR